MNERVQTLEMEQVFKRPLTKQRAFWIGLIFLASFAFRCEDFYLFREFNADKAHQLHAAYELLQGNGVSLESYDLNTFQAHQKPLVAWPPGYSYVVAGTSKVTGLSVYGASWAVDIFALAALWCVLLWFTFLLRFTVLQTAVLFLLIGYGRTPWVYLWSADTLGAALFLISAALNVYVVNQKGRKINVAVFALAQLVLISVMCFLKFSLFPAYFSLAFSVFSFSWKGKEKHYRAGLIMLLSILVSMGLLLLYNLRLSGDGSSIGSLEQQHRGLFFSNLLMYSPFLVKSLIYYEGIVQRMQSHRIELFLQALNLLVIFLILFHIGKRMLAGKADYFSHLVFWTTVCVCSFLSFLSVYYSQETFIGTYYWTYVKELRYFLPVIFLLTLYLIRNFQVRLPHAVFSAFTLAFIGFAALFGFGLNSYYKFTGNRAGSFENMVGRIVSANQFVHNRQDSNTYFLSLTGNSGVDAQVTSFAAINGSKVVISYDGIFPDAYLSRLFSKEKPLPAGKKVIIYISDNVRIIDSLNPLLPHRIEQDQKGDKFLLVNL